MPFRSKTPAVSLGLHALSNWILRAPRSKLWEKLLSLRKTGIDWSIEANHMVDGRLTYLDMEQLFSKAGYTIKTEKVNGYYFCWAKRSS